MSKKIKTLVTGASTAVMIAIVVVTAVLVNQHKTPPTSAVQGAQASQQQSDDRVTFVATRGKNVLEQLKEHATVQTKDSQIGPFVDSINGKKEDGKYWTFYVDGKMAQTGAADYVTQGGEKVEWKLE